METANQAGSGVGRGRVAEIALSGGLVAIVDAADAALVQRHRWCSIAGRDAERKPYVVRREWPSGKMIRLHRWLMEVDDDSGWEVDHINGNPLDNRRCNLRVCTVRQNRQNQRTQRVTKSSRFKGVYCDRRRANWSAQLVTGKEHVHLGSFSREEDAAKEYDFAAKAVFGAYARPNFFGE